MCPRGSGYALTLRAPRKRVLFTVSRFLGFFWGEGVWRFLFQKVFIYKINFFNRYKVMQIISLSLTCFEFLLLKNGSVYSKGVEFMCEELFLSIVVPYFPFNVSAVCSDIFSFISFFFLIYLFKFIYFWLCWVFVAVRGLSLVARSRGYSSLRCVDFSLWWLFFLRSTGSRCVGLSSCGSQAQ